MGCGGAVQVVPQGLPQAPKEDPPTVSIVPTADESAEKDAPDEEADQENSDAESVGSGPAGPTFAELLYRRIQTPADVFAEGEHDFCIFGETLPSVVEQEFEQKKLLSSRDEADPVALRENLALCGVGLTCRKGRKAGIPNQDNILFCRTSGYTICGVADGHGENGHWASHWVARFAMAMVLSDITSRKCMPTDSDLNKIFNVVHEALTLVSTEGVWDQTKDECSGKGTFDIGLSGSTLSLFIVEHATRKAVSAWVGDSRCVLFDAGDKMSALVEESEAQGAKPVGGGNLLAPSMAGKKANPFRPGNLRVQSITADHNPRDIGERQRMYSCGGQILGGRVQTGGKSGETESGLTMTRALGDLTLHSFGVIHKPGIRRIELGPQASDGTSTQGVLCCSDGVWEFLNNEEAAKYVGVGGREVVAKATEELVASARTRWLEQEEEETDDLSALVVWL